MSQPIVTVAVVIGIVLAAVFAVVAISVLIQVRRTLRSVDEFVQVTGSKLSVTLDEASGAARKAERVSANLEAITGDSRRFFEALGGLGSSLRRMSESVDRVGTTIGLMDNGVRKVPSVLNAVAAAAAAGVKAVVGGRRNERAGQTDGREADSRERSERRTSGASQW